MGSIPARGRLAAALPMSSPDAHLARRRSISPSESSSSVDSVRGISLSHLQRAMPIPGVQRQDNIPPPLPPPTYSHDLANGRDLAWRFENIMPERTTALPVIKEGSSLLGGFSKPKQQSPFRRSMEMDRNDIDERRDSCATIKASPLTHESAVPTGLASTTRRAPSPTTAAMLHGEQPLAQENIQRSNQAYDQALLSKIGKSNSPPRLLRSDSADGSTVAQKLSLQTQDVKSLQYPGSSELSAAAADVAIRWPTSPASNTASPFTKQPKRDHNGNPRSPMIEGASGPVALDPELFVSRSTYYRSATSSHTGADDTNSRSGRSSYDQAMYTPASDSFDGNLDDPQSDKICVRQGMKRKSPPCDEDRPRAELYPRLATRVASHSPTSNPMQYQSSLASTPSSAHQSSYNSSGAFSAAQGSIASLSSFETQSPREPLHVPSHITSAPSVVSSPSTLIAPKQVPDKITPHKMSAPPPHEIRPAPARIGNHYICTCCPKKPKKFESEEQLKTHENEKQYSCSYCNNRFKNKNEAERHQNSLHLRRHSWSCAALENYQAAFSPSGAIDSASATVDACGYCGEEFTNNPAPDWERRIDHLTNVHKFGECNSTKKFFRADHFRQHLKHSHAGKSGKWTNILEHACVRDELPPEATGYPISGNESPTAR